MAEAGSDPALNFTMLSARLGAIRHQNMGDLRLLCEHCTKNCSMNIFFQPFFRHIVLGFGHVQVRLIDMAQAALFEYVYNRSFVVLRPEKKGKIEMGRILKRMGRCDDPPSCASLTYGTCGGEWTIY